MLWSDENMYKYPLTVLKRQLLCFIKWGSSCWRRRGWNLLPFNAQPLARPKHAADGSLKMILNLIRWEVC